MDKLGGGRGPIAFGPFGVGCKKGVAFGGSAKTQSCFRLRSSGIAFGGVLSLLVFFSRFLCLTAFLLFVPNRRVLAIAHMYVNIIYTHTPNNCMGLAKGTCECSPM